MMQQSHQHHTAVRSCTTVTRTNQFIGNYINMCHLQQHEHTLCNFFVAIYVKIEGNGSQKIFKNCQ